MIGSWPISRSSRITMAVLSMLAQDVNKDGHRMLSKSIMVPERTKCPECHDFTRNYLRVHKRDCPSCGGSGGG